MDLKCVAVFQQNRLNSWEQIAIRHVKINLYQGTVFSLSWLQILLHSKVPRDISRDTTSSLPLYSYFHFLLASVVFLPLVRPSASAIHAHLDCGQMTWPVKSNRLFAHKKLDVTVHLRPLFYSTLLKLVDYLHVSLPTLSNMDPLKQNHEKRGMFSL